MCIIKPNQNISPNWNPNEKHRLKLLRAQKPHFAVEWEKSGVGGGGREK